MSKLREFVEQGPELCGVTGINAKRWGKKYADLFDAEIADKDSVFAMQDGESVEDRMDVLNGLYMASGAKREKVAYWIGTLMLAAYAVLIDKGRGDLAPVYSRLYSVLAAQEEENKDVAAVMSVEEAGTLTTWF